MDKNDITLINELKKTNKHLEKIWNDHLSYDKRIAEIERGNTNVIDNQELKDLKKLKLIGRDEIEKIIGKHRKG